jgi:molecular chaperone GrpE
MQSEEKPQDETVAPEAAEDSAVNDANDCAEDVSVEHAEAAANAILEEDAPADDASEANEPERDLEVELAEAQDRLLRALAESENVRRRASRDVENATKRSIANFAREMVVVADNLSRALGAVDKDKIDGNETVKVLLEGVEMTEREMQNAFSRNGIKKVDPLGERFDPQLHEAMFEFEDLSKPAGSVGQVMEPGYTLNDQSLRPAKVGVTKGGPKPGAAPAPSAQTIDEVDAENTATSGGNAYEDNGKPSGTNLDEEL